MERVCSETDRLGKVITTGSRLFINKNLCSRHQQQQHQQPHQKQRRRRLWRPRGGLAVALDASATALSVVKR